MGSSVSSLNALKQDDLVQQLISTKHVSHRNDAFWYALLSRESPFRRDQLKNLEETLATLQEQFLQNNPTSKNLASLVHVFVDKCNSLRSVSEGTGESTLLLVQTYNATLILRLCLRHLVQTLTEDVVEQHFISSPDPDRSEVTVNLLEPLLVTLLESLNELPCNGHWYHLTSEMMSILLILLSVQMYSARPVQRSVVYRLIMGPKCSLHAVRFTKCLLNHFIRQEAPPKFEVGGSLIIGLASGLWNVLSLGYGKSEEAPEEAVVAKMSCLLLLILTNHSTSEVNKYRETLFSCQDSHGRAGDPTSSPNQLTIDYASLFKTFSSIPNDDETTLLMYLLLHKNYSFRNFVMSRASDLDLIVIPILKVMYECPEKNSHHVYMALIVLLILSEDNLFNESVHDVTVKNISWYKEKVLHEVTLGNLIILVLIRATQFNIARTRDKFLHTNLLATLANMSSSFKHLSPYVCEKLVSLFRRLSKRFTRALKAVNRSQQLENGPSSPTASTTVMIDNMDVLSDTDTDILSVTHDFTHDLSIYEEVLRMLLEIINSCLASQMNHNPNLVYTLLYNQQIFDPFQANPSFQDVVANVDSVITYFSHQIKTESKEETPSVQQVYEIIETSAKKWPSEKLKNFPPLKFKYVEDDQPEEFFIPYVWSLVFKSSLVYFTPQNILLFNPHRNVV